MGLLTQPPYKNIVVSAQMEAWQSSRSSHTQDSVQGGLYMLSTTIRSPTTANYKTCENENSPFPNRHLNKAVEDSLCTKPRKLAKERRWTGSSLTPSVSYVFIYFIWNEGRVFAFSNTNPSHLSKRQCKSQHMLPSMISYHHNSLIYWKIISSIEGKPRITAL